VKGVADYDQGMSGKVTVVEAAEATRAKRAVLLKADLIEEVSRVVEVQAKEAAIIVELIFDKMVRALRSGDRVELRGFGVFNTRERRARTGRNPKTGAVVNVPAKKIAFFKPSRELKELVQNSKAEPASLASIAYGTTTSL
jgi:integration host factor subunit beta